MSVVNRDHNPISISPRLPPELEREIFETTAYQDLRSAYQLLFVAKRVYEWIEPMVYRVLMRFISHTTARSLSYPPLTYFSQEHDPPPRLKKVCSYTTHLLLQDTDADIATEILKLCGNVQDLALWVVRGSHRHLGRLVTTLRIERLSISLYMLLLQDDGFQFHPALFEHLTHLEIVDTAGEYRERVWNKLHLLPRLSHLALSMGFCSVGSNTRNSVDTILRDSATLQLLIICPLVWKRIEQEDFRDPRVVVFESSASSIDDWERGARGGEDFWKIGERMKVKRQTLQK